MEDPTKTTGPRKWRKTRQKLKKGIYWSLQAGKRGPERESISLGYVSEAEAEEALRIINDDEVSTYGTPRYDRILRLFKKDKAAARQHLISDTVSRQRFPELMKAHAVTPNYPALPIREYFELVYKPWRSTDKPKTWYTEEHYWTGHLLPAIGHVPLSDIDEYVMDEYLTVTMKKLDGSPSSYNMRRKARNAMTAMLKHARRKRHRSTPVPQWFRLEGSNETAHGEPETLTGEEARRLMEVAPPQVRAIIACGLGLGLRPNEITVMQWEDIDWDAGTVAIRGTKTADSAATLPFREDARAEVARWHAAQGEPTSGRLFRPLKGSPYREYRLGGSHVPWRKAFSTAVKAAGIDKRITPYALRHTCATWLVEDGVPIQSVAKLLRHSNPRMLERHYDHTGAIRAPGITGRARLNGEG